MISINATLEVDLVGQCASESIGPTFYSGMLTSRRCMLIHFCSFVLPSILFINLSFFPPCPSSRTITSTVGSYSDSPALAVLVCTSRKEVVRNAQSSQHILVEEVRLWWYEIVCGGALIHSLP